MAAAADSISPSVPPLAAASNLEIYSQFAPYEVPPESGAARAYKGFLRPFSDDATALRVVRALEKGMPVQVDAGRLDFDGEISAALPYEKFLTQMSTPFTVIALEFSDSQRPRTYLTHPQMVSRLSACEHLRGDKCIKLNGILLPALCVYSGNLLKLTNDRSEVEQILDQTATYLAKYLVWLKTRNLYRRTGNGFQLVRNRKPGEPVTATTIEHSSDLFWRGHWPGRCAPSTSSGHLDTIKPEDECWCWGGGSYGECCRDKDIKQIQEQRNADLVNKLMAAVRSKVGKF